MTDNNITAVPGNYKQAVKKELQGTLLETSYSAGNYINESRQLVTTQNIDAAEAGRDVVRGEPIIKKCNVYLPAGYDKNDADTKYNVLYLLHGVGGNSYEWLSSNGKKDDNYIICNIFDNLIANGDIEPIIVVFPEGRSSHDWTDIPFRSENTNILGFYYFDYEMKYDLIPFIESEYNTYADIKDKSPEGIEYNRRHRALAGLSMGGMQALNLGLGGYRYDSIKYTGTTGGLRNGLDATVKAPGMTDLFAYIGAFSNAPTSSDGKTLGASIVSGGYKLSLFYITCGDADNIAYNSGYVRSNEGLLDTAGDNLGDYYKIIIKDAVHNFLVWNNATYNFSRLCFGKTTEHIKPYNIEILLEESE